MLHLVASALEGLLRDELAAGATALDVAFDAPDREWSAKRNLPTVNCYLWHLGPNVDQVVSGMEVVEVDGRPVRRPILPKLDLRYLVTAWTDDPRDEQQLLGSVARTLVRHPAIPERHVPAGIAQLDRPQLRLLPRQPDDRADFWTALGGRYRPGLDLLVTTQIDPLVRFELAPRPREVRLAVTDRTHPPRRSWRVFGRREAEPVRR